MTLTDYGNEALESGVVLQAYQIQAILGKGGFGITYLALDRNLKQQVALKEFFPNEVAVRLRDNSVAPRSENVKMHYDWGKSRFLLEAQILAQFRHPNIVRVLTLFEANNTAYMAMDLERGRSLAEILDEHQVLEEAELRALLGPLLSGLEALHGQGFIHRDIKPENILVREDGSPVLIDFGSARNALGNRSQGLTTLLTPGYSPLEQYYSTSDDQGPWTDIYAFGGVLYRAISGDTPPESALRTSSALSGQNDPLTPAVTVGLGRYSRQFLEAVDKALQVLEKDRPQSVEEWRSMLFADPSPSPVFSPRKVVPEGRESEAPAPRKTEPFLLYINDDTRAQLQQNVLHGERAGVYEHVLVVADSMEHVRDDCAKLAAAGSGGFKALARGRQALRYLRENSVDLVLCDASLRDMAGLSFLHHMGQRHRLVPVLLTAHAAERGYVLDAVSLGAAGFLKRPISEDDMQRQLLQIWQITHFYGVEQTRLEQGRRLFSEHKHDEALEIWESVTNIVEEAREYYDSGFEALLENQFGQAMVAFKRGAKIAVLVMEAQMGQGQVHAAQGREKKAKACNLRAARGVARLRRLEETKQLFVSILKNKHHIPNPYNTLGVALRKQGDYAGAAHAYEKALQAAPEDARVHYNMARVLASNLEHDLAVERLEKALDLAPDLEAAKQLYKMISGANWEQENDGPLRPLVRTQRRESGPLSLLDE